MEDYRETQICPQCGKTGQCFVREVTADHVHYDDEYTFYCPDCRYTSKQRKYKGSTISSATKITTCPFCDINFREHRKAPKESSPNPAISKQDFLLLSLLTKYKKNLKIKLVH